MVRNIPYYVNEFGCPQCLSQVVPKWWPSNTASDVYRLLHHQYLARERAQLTLGVDRDSELVAAAFDERNPAVKALLSMAINASRDAAKYIGICGQGPSDHPDFASWLVDQEIESISLNPDTVIATWLYLASESAA